MHKEKFDFVIIGSGLGGLICAYLLLKEGHSVCVLEKNHQIGGTLQVFSRDKAILDTGVHYIGSLDKGETVYQLFSHLGILSELKLQRLDEEGFDLIELSDGFRFPYGQGHAQFEKNLYTYFPEEQEAIKQYMVMLQEVSQDFPLYSLQDQPYHTAIHWHMEIAASTYINQLTQNQRLRDVLTATNAFLYAGEANVTPLYVHALVQNSYLKGAYRLLDGGSQIAIALHRKITALGGIIRKRCEVISAQYVDLKTISSVCLSTGETIEGKHFISNIHPLPTMSIFGEEHFLKPYRRRVRQLPNTLSCFMLHIVFKKHSFPYLNYNFYKHHHSDVWAGTHYTEEEWPEQYFISTPATSKYGDFAESMSVMCYMRYEEVEQWQATYNTKTHPSARPNEYEMFKKKKEEQVIRRLTTLFPDIRTHIHAVYSCTPLTWRDYLNTPSGSMYGIQKEASHPIKSMLSTQTHISNLYLTGQNVVMHGILGVCIGALVTCFHFIDKKKLLTQITYANQT